MKDKVTPIPVQVAKHIADKSESKTFTCYALEDNLSNVILICNSADKIAEKLNSIANRDMWEVKKDLQTLNNKWDKYMLAKDELNDSIKNSLTGLSSMASVAFVLEKSDEEEDIYSGLYQRLNVMIKQKERLIGELLDNLEDCDSYESLFTELKGEPLYNGYVIKVYNCTEV